MEEKEKFEVHFIHFISSIYSTCMFQLGKIINPISGKIEKDLAGAKASIELLRMIEAKTRGNLSEKEKNTLADVLSNMQMNYVDEVNKEKDKKQEPEPKAKEEKKEQKTETKK